MGEAIKSTFFEVPRRPLGSLPAPQLPQSKVTEIPRGRVRDRIQFYENLREKDSPPRRHTTDSSLRFNRLNEVVDLDNPEVRFTRQTVGVPTEKETEEQRPQDAAVSESVEPVVEVEEQKEEPREESELPQKSEPAEDHTDNVPSPPPLESPVGVMSAIVEAPQPVSDSQEVEGTPLSTQGAVSDLLPELLSSPDSIPQHSKTESQQTSSFAGSVSAEIPSEQGNAPVVSDLELTRVLSVKVAKPPESFSRPQSGQQTPAQIVPSLKGDDEALDQFEQEMDAVCVNCLEYISLAEIDDHSLMCVKPTHEELGVIEEAALKIKKLHRAITRRIETSMGGRLIALIRLREIAVEITRFESAEDFELELEDIAASSLSIDGGFICSVYARRLITLATDMQQSSVEYQDPDLLLYRYNAEVEKQRKELLKWQAHNRVLEAMASAQLSEVQSDVGSDAGSTISRFTGAEDTDVADLQAAEEALRQVSDEELRKFFYQIAIKEKLLLAKTHPGQQVLISTLYQAAMNENIPVGAWDSFIRTRLLSTEA